MQQKQEQPGDNITQAIRWQMARPLQQAEGERLHREHVVWSRNLSFPAREGGDPVIPLESETRLFLWAVLLFF